MNEKSSCPVLRGRDDGNIILLPDHPAVSCDGERAHLLNGRMLRGKRQYRNKLMAQMDAKIARCTKGSKRRRKLIRAKQKRLGMRVVLQEESYTSRTCPVCGHRRKSSPRGRVFGCTRKTCKWQGHRDGVGAANIRAKYRGEFGSRHVVGTMAPPTGCGYVPRLRVSL